MRIAVQWIAPWRYRDAPLCAILFSRAHDDDSYFWRVLGFEITVRR